MKWYIESTAFRSDKYFNGFNSSGLNPKWTQDYNAKKKYNSETEAKVDADMLRDGGYCITIRRCH